MIDTPNSFRVSECLLCMSLIRFMVQDLKGWSRWLILQGYGSCDGADIFSLVSTMIGYLIISKTIKGPRNASWIPWMELLDIAWLINTNSRAGQSLRFSNKPVPDPNFGLKCSSCFLMSGEMCSEWDHGSRIVGPQCLTDHLSGCGKLLDTESVVRGIWLLLWIW